MPDVQPRLIRGWTDMFTRLLGENQHTRRKLAAKDMSLSWKPLWRVLRKEIQPRKRLLDSSYDTSLKISRMTILTELFLKAQLSEYFAVPRGEEQALFPA